MRTADRVPRRRPPRRAAGGVALIEALVSILLFSIGVLGVVALQSAMTRSQTSAKFRGDAVYLAGELIGAMWGDSANLASYADAQCSGYARCSDWAAKVAAVLPGGAASVTVDGAQVGVTIRWSAPGEGTHRYTTSTEIRL